jgi:hypothetical protein
VHLLAASLTGINRKQTHPTYLPPCEARYLKENTLMAAGIIVAIMFGIRVAGSAELWGRRAFGSIEKMVGRALERPTPIGAIP